MNLLEEFAANWSNPGLKVEGDRVSGCYGFVIEYNGQLWLWTHSYSPSGHEFFPLTSCYFETKALQLITAGRVNRRTVATESNRQIESPVTVSANLECK